MSCGPANGVLDSGAAVSRKGVHYHDVAERERRHPFDICQKPAPWSGTRKFAPICQVKSKPSRDQVIPVRRTGLSEINARSFPKHAALVVLRLRPRQRAGGRNVRPHRHRQAQRHRSAGLGSPMSSAGSWEPCRSGSTNSFRGTGKKTGDAIRLHSPGFSPGVSSSPFLCRHTPHEIPLRSFAHACRPRPSRAASSTTSARRSGLPLAFADNGAPRRAGQDVLIRRIARRENHGSDRACCRTYGQLSELSSLEGFCRHDVLAVEASDARTRVRSRRTNLL